jgi:hypothetical protein
VGIGLALLANAQLDRDRRLLLDRVGPARRTALTLETALINEETGVRGYLIAGEQSFLGPYRNGLQSEASALAMLRASERTVGPAIATEVETVATRVQAWKLHYVTPAIANLRRRGRRSISAEVRGKQLFDAVRASLGGLQSALETKDAQTRDQLDRAASNLEILLILAGVLILGGVLGAGYLLRQTITRPLARLGAEARRVAGGEFSTPLALASGPRELTAVGIEIEAMRERIVEELAAAEAARARLEAQARELGRSNAEL